MISRRSRVQERRLSKNGLFLIFVSLSLFIVLVVFGIPAIVRFAVFVSSIKGGQEQSLGEDKTPPIPPRLKEATNNYTRESKITMNGRAEANSLIIVFNNGKKVKELDVDDSSLFSVDIDLTAGENSVYAVARDQAGNESGASSTRIITFDNTPPDLQISKPADGETVYESGAAVEGKTEPGAKVTVNDRMVIVNNDGSFSQKITLVEGQNTINITVLDPADNKTEKQIKVTYSP